MLPMSFRVDKNVVYEDYYKLIKERSKDFVPIVHEQDKSISYTKRHNYIVIMPIFVLVLNISTLTRI